MSTDLALRRAVRTLHGSQCSRLSTARPACWPHIARISITAYPCTWTFSPAAVPSAGFKGSTWSWAALEAHSTCRPTQELIQNQQEVCGAGPGTYGAVFVVCQYLNKTVQLSSHANCTALLSSTFSVLMLRYTTHAIAHACSVHVAFLTQAANAALIAAWTSCGHMPVPQIFSNSLLCSGVHLTAKVRHHWQLACALVQVQP